MPPIPPPDLSGASGCLKHFCVPEAPLAPCLLPLLCTSADFCQMVDYMKTSMSMRTTWPLTEEDQKVFEGFDFVSNQVSGGASLAVRGLTADCCCSVGCVGLRRLRLLVCWQRQLCWRALLLLLLLLTTARSPLFISGVRGGSQQSL